MATMCTIHHINIVHLVGFCVDRFKRVIIYEYLPNESLEKFIFLRAVKNYSLGWKKLQEIAIGIAKGIEYLHQGCDQRILIKVVIKESSMLISNLIIFYLITTLIQRFMTLVWPNCAPRNKVQSLWQFKGNNGGYIAPEVLSRNFGNVSYKLDIYSFEMLLLEMVGGMKNIDVSVESTSQVYFLEWIYNHLDIRKELHIQIEEKWDVEVAKKLTIMGLSCIQWCPVDRPSMKIVIQILEGEWDEITMPPNPFTSTIPTKTNLSKPRKVFQQELAIISKLK